MVPVRIERMGMIFVLGLGLFTAGFAMGQGRFGQPRTVVHVVSIQWKQGVSDEEKQSVLHGIKEMAATIPGIKNVWVKSDRVEPRGFDDGFAIEFENRAAAEAYASSPIHKAWNERYLSLRSASISIDLTNQ